MTCEVVGDKETSKLRLQDAVADYSQPNWPVENAIDGNRKTGWAIAGQFGKPHWSAFTLATPATLDPEAQRLRITLGQFFGRGRVMGKPRISVFSGDTDLLGIPAEIVELAGKEKPSKADLKKLRAQFDLSNPELKAIDRQVAAAKKSLTETEPDTTLVMVEMDKPRETFVMIRGDYENLGDKVKPGSPTALPVDRSVERTGDRMEFARWLTSPANPLLARVTVNRWWAEIFGHGIVRTPEDFRHDGR